jgi:hypothetical protein
MKRNQPLLPITHWLVDAAAFVCMLVCGLLTVALIGIGFTAFNAKRLGIPASFQGVPYGDAFAAGAVAVASGLIGVGLLIFVFRAISAIIASAMSDDPFIDENADRLSRVGWLLVGLAGLQAATGMVLEPLVEKIEAASASANINIDGVGPDMSPISILTILLVFVLAQIFRRGAEMRGELEGTV